PTDATYVERAAVDDAEGFAARAGAQKTLARHPVIPPARLRGMGGGPARDALTPPRAAGQLLAKDVGHVRLHAHGLAVRFTRRPVRAALVAADVAVGTPVCATHVRVQRPSERHPLHGVQRAPARLLAIHPA